MNSSLARITSQRATADKGSPIALANLTNQSDRTSQNIHTVSHAQAQRSAKGLDPKASANHPRNVPDQAHARLANLVSAYAANSEITLCRRRALGCRGVLCNSLGARLTRRALRHVIHDKRGRNGVATMLQWGPALKGN